MPADVKTQVREATQASLTEDAMLQMRVTSICRACVEGLGELKGCHTPPILAHNTSAASPEATLAYWDSLARPLKFLDLFRPTLAAGGQPVFAAISLRVSSNDPTIVVPVPYAVEGEGADRIRQHLWINADESDRGGFEPELAAVDDAILEVSHALTNLSYSVRLQDVPLVGWLADAHVQGRSIYCPDVRRLQDNDEIAEEVHSAAAREQPYLAMASVLYVPLAPPTKADEGARAVLILWSPVPGRWDSCFHSIEPIVSNALAVDDLCSPPVREHIWKHFHWMEYAAAKDDMSLRRAELQILNFMSLLIRWQQGQQPAVRTALNEILHMSSALLDHFREAPKVKTTSVVDWIDELLHGSAGFVDKLRRRWQAAGNNSEDLDALPILLRSYDRPGERFRRLLSELPEEGAIADYVDPKITIPLDAGSATYMGGEPVDNIAKYAQSLREISITLSQRFVTVRYAEEPKAEHLARLWGSDEAFRRYYAVRRGLAISPPIDAADGRMLGHGLGFWLYRIVAARTQVWRKLYVSPDGAVCHTDLVVPLHRGPP